MAERSITIKILGDAKGVKGAFDDASKSAGTFEGKIEGADGKFGGFASTMSGFLAAGAVQKFGSFLKDGAEGAAEDEAAMLRLETAVKNTGKSYDDFGGSIDDAIKRGQDLAFTDGETADALSKLISLTGDTDEGMRRLASAQDLARGAGISLDQAATLLGKTSDENTAALGRLGIKLGENATAQDVLNEVDKKFAGQAATFAESDAGKFEKAQQNVGELAETLGGALVPAVSLAAGLLLTMLQVVSPLLETLLGSPPVLIGMATAIGAALVPALIAKTTALWASVGAWLAANAAMLPIIALALAIGAAVALLYLAWDSNFLGIQDITKRVIDFIWPYIETAMGAIQSVIETVLGAIRAAWDVVWPYLQAALEIVWTAISTAVTTYIGIVRTVIETALGIIQTVWGTVWPAVQVVAETVFAGIRTVVETVMPIIQGIVETVLGAIRLVTDTVLVPVQGVFSDVFDTIKTLVDTAMNGVGGVKSVYGAVVGFLSSAINTAKEGIQGAWDGITGGIKGAIEGIVEPIRTAVNKIIGFINGIIGAWNDLEIPGIEMPGAIPDIPGIGTPDVPLLPTMARGGYVPATRGGMLALLAEGGEGEHVIGDRKLKEALAQAGGNGSRQPARSVVVNLNIGGERFERLIIDTVDGQVRREY